MQISKAQERAIVHGTGPAMVLAGPGSGKTLVITNRTKYLVEHCGVHPSEILVITFTKAAAAEMRERFSRICPSGHVTFGTFHAVFFAILKAAYHYTGANILKEEQKFQILKGIAAELRITYEDEKEFLSELVSEISLIKNEQVDLNYYYSKACPEESFRLLFRKYEEIHKKQGLLDFDDMLVYTYELLKARKDILAAWQNRFRYILVDEFQDINHLQYEVVRMLAAPQNNLFIVGDDDQSIYRFRGAKPEIMLRFPKDYPDAKVIELDRNFRSTHQILSSAVKVIRENKKRYDKKQTAVRGEGLPVDLQEFQEQDHESLYLVKCISERLREGVPLSDIAVLFRTNQGGRAFAERLLEFNIPFVIRDALPNIYDHWLAGDIFAYLHLAHEGLDRAEFLRVMNRPKRYLSRDYIDGKVVSFDTLEKYLEEKEWMLERLDKLQTDLRILRTLKPFAAVNYIRFAIGYEDYLKEYAATRKIPQEELIDLANELQESARAYQTIEDWYDHIEQYRQKLEDRGKQQETEKDAVTLATLHSSKGLEFREVFLVDVNQNIIPHRKASLEADLEEERRLFYVGMTRAKDLLHLFYIKEQFGRTMQPSEFLDPLLEDHFDRECEQDLEQTVDQTRERQFWFHKT